MPGCLILDEPTAVLTPNEIADLEQVVRDLADSGKSIIFITHKLGEVMRLADRIAVLRGGRVVGHATPAETDPHGLASMMVGRDVRLVVEKTLSEAGPVVLAVEDLVVADDRNHVAVDQLTFDVRAGRDPRGGRRPGERPDRTGRGADRADPTDPGSGPARR